MENRPQNVTCWWVKWIYKGKERLHFSLPWWSKVRQLRVSASPLVLQTRGPWFRNEMQILLSSKRTTSNRWESLRFFFCLHQVRRLWRCLWFRSGFILRMQQLKGACVCGGSWSTDAKFLDGLFLRILSKGGSHPCFLCIFFLLDSVLSFNFPLLHSVNNQPFQQWDFVDYPVFVGCRLSVKSAAFLVIVVPWTELDWKILSWYLHYVNSNLLKLKVKHLNNLRYWISNFNEQWATGLILLWPKSM